MFDINTWAKDIEISPFKGVSKVAEAEVEDSLKRHGLKRLDIEAILLNSGYRNKTEMIEALYHDELHPEEYVQGTDDEPAMIYPLVGYIAQPLGTQKSPDFIVLTNEGDKYFIEVKASKKPSGYQFNSHLIKDDYIYVLSDPSVGFKVFEGICLIDPEVRQLLHNCHQECKAIQDKCNEKISAHSSNTQGWGYYARSMYTQRNVYA